jgi:hypothetical protein
VGRAATFLSPDETDPLKFTAHTVTKGSTPEEVIKAVEVAWLVDGTEPPPPHALYSLLTSTPSPSVSAMDSTAPVHVRSATSCSV